MSLKRKSIFATLALFAAAVVIGALALGRGEVKATEKSVNTIASVDIATVVSRNITDWQSYSGRLQAIDHVDIRALVPGTIMVVFFKDGQLVKKGDLLFLIDPRPYVAAADRAQAQLEAAEAHAKFASADYARAQKLMAGNATSKRDFDEKSNDALEADANVKAAKAALESARVDLAYTRIIAPVSGRMSRAEMTVGNIVSVGAGTAPLTSLVSVSPIYAAFDVDERTYLNDLSRTSSNAVPVRLGLANETGYSRIGKISSVDNQIDGGSGTIRVRAIFDNSKGDLLPGLYARVAVEGGEPHAALLIDERAVSTDQAKKFVLAIDANRRVQYREVTLGSPYEGLREVTRGLRPGESIVVNGLQRVHAGDEVRATSVPMSGENMTTQTL